MSVDGYPESIESRLSEGSEGRDESFATSVSWPLPGFVKGIHPRRARYPVFGFSYSDHFAVEAFFTVYPSQSSRGVDSDEPIDQRATTESNQTDIRPPSLTSEQINNCISALMIKYRSSERSSQIQLSLFIICIILCRGMTMLYSGFLAGNWERSAIQEICDQLEFQLNLTLQHQNQNHHLSL
ncbi:hypothetical protein PSHT_07116 [Puccinia striiformis]|uniref:Uncharacterized protein n=1 Tax=Puccinia striiformis TaxID=27350 RepID=A0A2S4W0X1_9BASI|nr:hypothetical protein PSHT_07116 [Puccinia striiformis]